MSGQTSGTFNFANIPISELLIEALERCGKSMVELDIQYVRTGTRSLNLVLVSWANRGINLWTVFEFVRQMPQGVIQYVVPPRVIDVMPDSVVLRQYQMGAPVSVPPAFTTTLGSPNVVVSNLAATPAAGQFISVGVSISVGGLILSGFYKVLAVPGTGQAEFVATSNATASTSGGAVPSITGTVNSTTMTVVFDDHGLLIGQSFVVQVTTVVGGVSLLGPYPVTSVINANTFTIAASQPAGQNQTVSENGGNAYLATQATVQGLTQTAYPVDIVLYPLSRGDYMAIPLKQQQGRPTSFWLDRQISPVFNVWLVPDQNGPYELRYRASQQVQDASIMSGQTIQLPYRMIEAFVSNLASMLSMKIAPALSVALKAYADEQWDLAADEDREKVSTFMVPDLSSYFTNG